ncbi:MAG: zf-TFIIB domain-containing protein [bacterium]|nr:zf-TFIIB domain-containing protein [bacterium]
MKCPQCSIPLEKTLLMNVEVDYCPRCLGMWFEEDELRQAKDERDRDLRWLDIDLWKDHTKFRVSSGRKLCPAHRLPLYEVSYGDSSIKVDVCSLDYGVWLDRGEFKEILNYLKERQEHEILYHYASNLMQESWEVFAGPEMLREEIVDFLTIIKMLRYKFAVQNPKIAEIISNLPR